MYTPEKYIKTILLLLFIFLSTVISAQNTPVCDSLLSKGNKALNDQNYIKSLELFTEARLIAEKRHLDKQTYTALMGIGNTYYAMLDYGEALNYFLDAYTVAVKNLKAEEELATLNNIANLYTKEKMYDKAIEYYSKAYDIANEKNINSRKGLPLMNLGYIYNQLKEPQKARPYILQSMPYLKGQVHFTSTKVLLIENDMLSGNPELAIKKSWELFNSTPDSEKANLDIYLWLIISKCYFAQKDYPRAAQYSNKILAKYPNLNPEIKRDIFELLSNIYHKSGSFDLALQYRDSIIATDKKLDEVKNGRLFENNRVKFEIQNYKNQIDVNEEKLVNERRIFYATLAIILAGVIITLLILRQKKIIAERNQHITELNLEKEKNNNLLLEKKIIDTLLEQEQLKNDIEMKNRKLSAKALYLSDRNDLIEEIVSYLSKKPQLAKDQTLANHVRSLKANLRTDNEWDNFITHFEEVNHGFLQRLKALHPALTANDVRFIAYIYMNLSIKEIASILNITIVACKKRKERLALKMEIPKEMDLFDYVSVL